MSQSLTESGIPSFNDPVRDMTHLLYGSRMRLSTPRTAPARLPPRALRSGYGSIVIGWLYSEYVMVVVCFPLLTTFSTGRESGPTYKVAGEPCDLKE